jgi:hypothetical protein
MKEKKERATSLLNFFRHSLFKTSKSDAISFSKMEFTSS